MSDYLLVKADAAADGASAIGAIGDGMAIGLEPFDGWEQHVKDLTPPPEGEAIVVPDNPTRWGKKFAMWKRVAARVIATVKPPNTIRILADAVSELIGEIVALERERRRQRGEIMRVVGERDDLRDEVEAALDVLDPSMRESGIVDACKQRMQAYVSARGNCETMEARNVSLYKALLGLVNRLDEIENHPSYKAVVQIASVHGVEYQGPNWAEPRTVAAEALGLEKRCTCGLPMRKGETGFHWHCDACGRSTHVAGVPPYTEDAGG